MKRALLLTGLLLLAACGKAGSPGSDAGLAADAGHDAGMGDAGLTGLPSDGGFPIKYIVVLIKENHTFDNYFTGFPGATSSPTAKLSDGGTLTRPLAPTGGLKRDLCHTHACAVQAFHGGANDRLDLVSGATANGDDLAYIQYTESQIPNYWQYARDFVLADHFFSTTLAQSFPGHDAIVMGWNQTLDNPPCTCGGTCQVSIYDLATGAPGKMSPCWDVPSIVDALPAGFTWREYTFSQLNSVKSVSQLPDRAAHFKAQAALLTDLTDGPQANLIFAHLEGGQSEHPPQAVCPGENQTVQLVNAIMNGPHWNETAVLVTWDDWGGFYDSVPPPAKKLGPDYYAPGFRVPLLVISPFAKKGFVLKDVSEQGSIVKLVEDLWQLPRMQPRDARVRDEDVGSLLPAFDFSQQPRAPRVLSPRVCP